MLAVVVIIAVVAGLVIAGHRRRARLGADRRPAWRGARPPDGFESERLTVCVEALCLGAGLPTPRLAVVDDDATAALAYGRGPRSATVAVTTGAAGLAGAVRNSRGTLAHLLSRIADGTARRDTLLAALALLAGPPGAALGVAAPRRVARRGRGRRRCSLDTFPARCHRSPAAHGRKRRRSAAAPPGDPSPLDARGRRPGPPADPPRGQDHGPQQPLSEPGGGHLGAPGVLGPSPSLSDPAGLTLEG